MLPLKVITAFFFFIKLNSSKHGNDFRMIGLLAFQINQYNSQNSLDILIDFKTLLNNQREIYCQPNFVPRNICTCYFIIYFNLRLHIKKKPQVNLKKILGLKKSSKYQ